MVFESLLVDILNRYLKPYVKHLDTSQLKVGVWKGRAKLEKLELKEELFAELDLDVPLKIKKSYIGQLELFIPWKRLTKDPLIVKIEDVYAIVTPDLSVHYDAEVEHARMKKEKAKNIEKLKEASKKLKKKDKDAKKEKKKKKKVDDEGDSKPDTFTEKLVTNLLKNLIVKVSRIHVRYEDPVTNVGTKFSVGVTLDNLELKSTDSNWTVQSAIKEASTLVYKLLELNALGVYWEAPSPMLLDLEDTWMKEMKERIFLKTSPGNLTTQYVLWPLSATAKLTLSVKPGGVDLSTPQVQVGVDCDSIALAVREEQFKSALETMDTYEWYNLNRQFWKYKPGSPLRDDKKAWWKYAFNAVSEDVRRRLQAWSWVHIKAHRDLCRQYQKKYREKVHSVSVSSSLKQELESLEEKLDVPNIMMCRRLAKQGKLRPSLPAIEPKTQPPPFTPTQPQPPPVATTPTIVTTPTAPNIPALAVSPVPPSQEQGPPKPKHPPPTLVQRTSEVEIAGGGGVKGEVPPSKGEVLPVKPARPSGRVVVETLSVQKKKEKEEKGGFFSNLKKKFKTGSDDTNHPVAVTPPPKGPLPPGGVQSSSGSVSRPPQGAKVQAEPERPIQKRGSTASQLGVQQSEGASGRPTSALSSAMEEPSDAEVVTERDPEQEERERREFMLAIGYSEDGELEDLPKEYVAQKIMVNLKTVKLDIIGQTQLAQFTATDIGANVALRPAADGVSVSAGIGSLELTGVPKGDQRTVMLSSCISGGTGTKLIDLALEINPLNSDKDVIVKASLRPIQVTYDAPTVDGLVRALLVRKVINLQEVSAAASSGLNELKEQTKARLKDALAARKKIDLDITLHSPYIIVPEGGVYSERSQLVVVSLGKVMVNTLEEKAPSKGSDDVSKYYDKFSLKLQGMQVLLAKPGEDWLAACSASTSSSLHIVEPTGFEIFLEQKIGTADPYLPSTRVKGTLKTFEVKLSDDKLASLISIGMGFPIPPIQDRSTYYDNVAAPPARLLDELYVEPDDETVSLSSLQLSQQGDSDEESSETSSLTSALASGPDKLRQVFIGALVDVSVENLKLELTKHQPQSGQGEEEPLFYVEVSNLCAHVTDGKFDTQGTVSMGGVTVLDYITKGRLGKPTQLLKTMSLQDGNFVTVNFATISAVGEAYAKVYSGLRNSVKVQASSVEMVVNRTTISGVMSLAKSIRVQGSPSKSGGAATAPGSIATTTTTTTTTPTTAKARDFFFDVKFDGINLAMDDCEMKILSTAVKGFEVNGSILKNETHVAASMEDVMVHDTSPGALVRELVTKTDDSKKMIVLEVIDYHKKAQRNPTNLKLSDVALTAVIQRVTSTLSTPFLANVLGFVQHLQLDANDLKSAAMATASTATATAGAIRESVVRIKLDVTLHAPLLKIPYKLRRGEGHILVDLGEFKLTNSFVSGADIMAEKGLYPLSTNNDAKAILDKMVIQSTAIEVYRLHRSSSNPPAEQRSTILEPVVFTAYVVRNLTPQIVGFPKADVSLDLDVVKFTVSDQDVEALATVGLATSKAADVISSIFAKGNQQAALQEAEVGPKQSEVNNAAKYASPNIGKDLCLRFSLRMVTLHVSTADVQLLRASASDTAASVEVYCGRLVISASVKNVSVLDTNDGANHSTIVSQVDSSDAASSLKLKVFLEGRGVLDPLGELNARVSQIRLVLPLPFIIRMVSFIQKIEIQPDLITNATKAAKDGAKVVQAAAHDNYDKYMLVNVTICAPVVFIPLIGESPQALVVNMGDFLIKNQLTNPQPSINMDTYGMTLSRFQVSRALVDLKAEQLDVKAERILLHPFSMSLVLDHNLSAERSELPSIGVKLTMSELKIYLGQEEFEVIVATGLDIADKIADLVPRAHKGEVRGAIQQGLISKESTQEPDQPVSKDAVYTVVTVTSTLEKFQLKLFSEEPHLAPGVKDSIDLPDSCSLTTFQLAGMVLSTSVSSNQNVDLTASMKDITLLDDQGRKKNKKIGDRMIQHYTKNPLVPYSAGTAATPIAKIEYHLNGGEHSVNLGMDQLLILSDLDFIFAMKDYFTKVADDAKAKVDSSKSESRNRDRTTQSSASAALEPSVGEQTSASILPKIKVVADIRNLCVAIVESGNTEEPQALQLKLSSYFNLQLTEKEKKGFFNIVNLSIATCNFSDLDTTSSWVLLPTTMMMSFNGPLVGSAMSVDARMESVKITLSHSIMLLIIHAVKTLIPEKKVVKVKTPRDLWMAKNLSDMKLWFLSETQHNLALPSEATEAKEEYFELELVSVELILESESTQKSDGIPILAVNLSAKIRASEWTGQLSVEGDIRCEASYYNERLSLWEPLLEPLEGIKGENLYPWTIHVQAKKSLPSGAGGQEEPKFAVSLQSTYPLQLTLTVTSLHIIKDLVTAYTKEYGKKLFGSVNIQSLTGAPFTFINKLGAGLMATVKPGPSLKLPQGAESARLSAREPVNMQLAKFSNLKSSTSVIVQASEPDITAVVAVDSFKSIDVVINKPGQYYYTLEPDDSAVLSCGLVVDVSVTGVKKTITLRSSIQIKNSCSIKMELLFLKSKGGYQRMTTIDPDDTYCIPMEAAYEHLFFVLPTGKNMQPVEGSEGFAWYGCDKPEDFRCSLECSPPDDDSISNCVNVTCREEQYKNQKQCPSGSFAHHIFQLHPPMVLQNLLPFRISVQLKESGSSLYILEPGTWAEIYDVNLNREPVILFSFYDGFSGELRLSKQNSEYNTFTVVKGDESLEVNIYTERMGYEKFSVYCPYWMVNKTGLALEYKEGSKVVRHPADKAILVYSSGPKSKIQLAATTVKGNHTEWSKSFPIISVGSSDSIITKFKEATYQFGVEVQLSQFTLSKLVVLTPYYLVVNHTEFNIQIQEADCSSVVRTSAPPGKVTHFWPTCDSTKVHIAVDFEGGRSTGYSCPFNYKKSDFLVLQLNEPVVAVCVEVQETGSSNIITFSNYYPGCLPVLVINHFPDLALQFGQSAKSTRCRPWLLQPQQAVYYTWDDPTDFHYLIRWQIVDAVAKASHPSITKIDITKDGGQSFTIKLNPIKTASSPTASSPDLGWNPEGSIISSSTSISNEDEDTDFSIRRNKSGIGRKGYWRLFNIGLQRVLLFTDNSDMNERIKAESLYSMQILEASLSLKAVGLSLVDDTQMRELAYVAFMESGIIWQVKKGKKENWKTLSTSINAELEEAYQSGKREINQKHLVANLANHDKMTMLEPSEGPLRRTHHEGVHLKFTMSDKDYTMHAKVGYLQVDNQLPFCVYPQLLYPLPPPPTVATSTEPKPLFEASVILNRGDQDNAQSTNTVKHLKYVHVLIQKMAVNADLGFILALVDFFSFKSYDPSFEKEYVKNDVLNCEKTLQEVMITGNSEEFSRLFLDIFHIAPIKVTLSFNIRSVGRNNLQRKTVGDQFVQLFLHSVGIILTSVQEAEMKFSFFHLEYQPQSQKRLISLFTKHYTTQALFQLHTLIFGLDALGSPITVVRGLAEGTFDLFYEPIKGSVLGPEEFLQGLGIGLKSFLGGTVGGLTGAGAKITGAVGDVFAKLTFDDNFIDKRQQDKTKSTKLGHKLGGFAMNLFEGVTGVVTQPVKGLQKEGAIGLLKGTGKGLVGLLVRPAGGLFDLTSGTLHLVTKKTKVGDVEIEEVRPPRFIGRDGAIRPYIGNKALGQAILVTTDDGKYVDSDYLVGHLDISEKKTKILLVTDRHLMLVEPRIIKEGWDCIGSVHFKYFRSIAGVNASTVLLVLKESYKSKFRDIPLPSKAIADAACALINKGYAECSSDLRERF